MIYSNNSCGRFVDKILLNVYENTKVFAGNQKDYKCRYQTSFSGEEDSEIGCHF